MPSWLWVTLRTVDAALIGLAGIVVGALLTGTGRYFSQRRDAWREARASGLLLLAEVRALRGAQHDDAVVATTRLGTTTWSAHKAVLAGFRQGTYPSGFKAPEWLTLASHMAELEALYVNHHADADGTWWTAAQHELSEAYRSLSRFGEDPPVFRYVVCAMLRAVARRPRAWIGRVAKLVR